MPTLSCSSIAAAAERVAAAAQAGSAASARERAVELVGLVGHHVEQAERELSTVARRALLHEHRRCAQLARAIELAVDDADLARAAAQARALARLAVAHEEKERAYAAERERLR